LLASPNLAERLRQQIQTYTNTIRIQRARWYEELAQEMELSAASIRC
jgi:hypothetical protein